MDGLDEYQAFQFDLGVAWKGHLREAEEQQNLLYAMLEGMRGIMQSNGAKVSNIPKPQTLVKNPKEDEVPLLSEVLNAFGGPGVKVE